MANDIIIQAQDTAFQRTGNTYHRKGYAFLNASYAESFLNLAVRASAIGEAISVVEQQLLYNIMNRDQALLPGGKILKDVYDNIVPSAFNGAEDLQHIYHKDPFDTEYEDETRALYERQYLKARATAQSGPTSVRGGTARVAFELAALDVEMANNRFREIWQAQMALAQLVTASVQIAANAETERWRLQLAAQQAQLASEVQRTDQAIRSCEVLDRLREVHTHNIAGAIEFLGQSQMGIEESLQGFGQQGSAQTTFGMSYWR